MGGIKNLYGRISGFFSRLEELQRRGTPTQKPVEMEYSEHVCLNCKTHFRGNYCPHCGQNASQKRLTIHEPINTVLNILISYDHGISHTLLELIYRPGYMAYDYIRGKRAQYIKPLQLLFLLAAIALFLQSIIGRSSSETENTWKMIVLQDEALNNLFQSCLTRFFDFMSSTTNRALVSALLFAFPMWLANHFCRIGKHINIVESFYMNIFVNCMELLFVLLMLPFELLWNLFTGGSGMVLQLNNFFSIFLVVYVIHQFYRIAWWRSVFHAVLYYLYSLIFTIALVLLGLVCLLLYGRVMDLC